MKSLKRVSAQTGRSVSDLVREGVDRLLITSARPDLVERKRRALAAMGRFKFRSGLSDVSERHDHYLAEACGE